jgi:hypothetical protein
MIRNVLSRITVEDKHHNRYDVGNDQRHVVADNEGEAKAKARQQLYLEGAIDGVKVDVLPKHQYVV